MKDALTVQYSLEKDKANYEYSLIDKAYPSYGREKVNVLPFFAEELQGKIDSVSNRSRKLQIIDEYIESNYANKLLLNQASVCLQESWNLISEQYVNRLKKYFQISNKKTDPVNCYLTSLRLCPYDHQKRYFYVSIFAGLIEQTYIIMHELMHIIFLENYESILAERGLSKQDILEINEALIELLNLEFSDLLVFKVYNNKPSAKDLAEIVVKEYNQGSDFQEILEKLIQARL
jgi:hypothetical protein